MEPGSVDDHLLPIVAATGLLFAGLGGAAFYGWLQYGSSILLALDESGLSWCF